MAEMDFRVRLLGKALSLAPSVTGMTDEQLIARQRKTLPRNRIIDFVLGSRAPGTVTSDLTAAGADGRIGIRVYRPTRETGPLPLIVNIHGGGWVSGNLDMGDWLCGRVAKEVGAVVVSLDYRLAPNPPVPGGRGGLLRRARRRRRTRRRTRRRPGQDRGRGRQRGRQPRRRDVPARAGPLRPGDRLPGPDLPGHRHDAEQPVAGGQRRSSGDHHPRGAEDARHLPRRARPGEPAGLTAEGGDARGAAAGADPGRRARSHPRRRPALRRGAASSRGPGPHHHLRRHAARVHVVPERLPQRHAGPRRTLLGTLDSTRATPRHRLGAAEPLLPVRHSTRTVAVVSTAKQSNPDELANGSGRARAGGADAPRVFTGEVSPAHGHHQQDVSAHSSLRLLRPRTEVNIPVPGCPLLASDDAGDPGRGSGGLHPRFRGGGGKPGSTPSSPPPT
ncbi:alpha/beta hydrolase [Saccharopolyspora aridisoli]|uniref:Alpha/beta hydrolase n=1 Tax=Saccharopolyspora aridisoli TaxID=2530385 RepID=A0A4V2Y7M8_9PSEU|nr:alpha/beta hydrolase [Saccharopolyspora aridisoli]